VLLVPIGPTVGVLTPTTRPDLAIEYQVLDSLVVLEGVIEDPAIHPVLRIVSQVDSVA
jgi:hypothetical protein